MMSLAISFSNAKWCLVKMPGPAAPQAQRSEARAKCLDLYNYIAFGIVGILPVLSGVSGGNRSHIAIVTTAESTSLCCQENEESKANTDSRPAP